MLNLLNCTIVLHEKVQIPCIGILLGTLSSLFLPCCGLGMLDSVKFSACGASFLLCCLSTEVPLLNPAGILTPVLNIQHKCHFSMSSLSQAETSTPSFEPSVYATCPSILACITLYFQL